MGPYATITRRCIKAIRHIVVFIVNNINIIIINSMFYQYLLLYDGCQFASENGVLKAIHVHTYLYEHAYMRVRVCLCVCAYVCRAVAIRWRICSLLCVLVCVWFCFFAPLPL